MTDLFTDMQLIPMLASAGLDPVIHAKKIGGFLGGYYILLALMNGVAAYYWWQIKKQNNWALVWTLVATLMAGIFAPLAGMGHVNWMPRYPAAVSHAIDAVSGPVVYTLGTTLLFGGLFQFRKFFVQPNVAWSVLNIMCLMLGLALSNANFAEIVTKGDNVPIVGLVFLLAFFTWLATAKAVKNDERAARGEPPLEALDNEKVLVWPDLVYTELICMIALTAFLMIWSICITAPLEEPASGVKTPNPSKAPWYFLGLQEMLVYYDPWYAGVVLPSLVIAGLAAIPYLDFNKKGNGYYTIAERKFSYLIFQFGFLELWITLIILGTFLRGPNWNFYGPFEVWDAHKSEVLTNKDLSKMFWVDGLGMALPQAPSGSGGLTQFLYILQREIVGIVLVGAYFVLLPPIMAATIFRKFFVKMGFLRYMMMSNLLLFMMSLPIKMVLRWVVNLKYLISIPEWFLSF